MEYDISDADADAPGATLYRSWDITARTGGGWTVFLSRKDGEYVMESPMTGIHRLAVDETSADRLRAHWAGFIAANYARTNEVELQDDVRPGVKFLPKIRSRA